MARIPTPYTETWRTDSFRHWVIAASPKRTAESLSPRGGKKTKTRLWQGIEAGTSKLELVYCGTKSYKTCRAMVQAVSRRPLTAEARVRSRVSPCEICGGQSGTGTGFSPSTSVFPCHFHFTGPQLLGKMKKKLIIFITGLHNKPQGCGASVASAAGPVTTRKFTKQRMLDF
jgi:hypothetical protein